MVGFLFVGFGDKNILTHRLIDEECGNIIFIPELKNWLQMNVAQTETLQDLLSVQYSPVECSFISGLY